MSLTFKNYIWGSHTEPQKTVYSEIKTVEINNTRHYEHVQYNNECYFALPTVMLKFSNCNSVSLPCNACLRACFAIILKMCHVNLQVNLSFVCKRQERKSRLVWYGHNRKQVELRNLCFRDGLIKRIQVIEGQRGRKDTAKEHAHKDEYISVFWKVW